MRTQNKLNKLKIREELDNLFLYFFFGDYINLNRSTND